MPQRCEALVPGTLYHVSLRGAYRRDVFFSPKNRHLLIDILTEVIERFAGKLHCYSNFGDSLQLLIQVGEEPLGRTMLRVARRYAHAVIEHSDTPLPDVADVVNRLFEMRFRATVRPDSGIHRPRLTNRGSTTSL